MPMKRLFLLLAILINLTAYAETDSLTFSASAVADSIIVNAKKYIGVRYRSSGMSPEGFDCSGFTNFIFKKFGYNLIHGSSSQATQGRPVGREDSSKKTLARDLQKGDLLFFEGSKHNRKVGHVAIYTGEQNEDGSVNFIHATIQAGVIISNINEDYYSSRYLTARRILPDFAPPRDSSIITVPLEPLNL